jgi:hypothetical protein
LREVNAKAMSEFQYRKEKFAYPWAMAPTINMTRPVATAIATFVSIDKLIIFPFSYASLQISACLWTPGARSSIYFPKHCEIGFLGDSGASSKPEDEGGKSASGARQGRCDVGGNRSQKQLL